MDAQFYTYLYLRYDGTPYYVGKGRGRRAFYRFERNVCPPRDVSRIVIQEHLSEAAAFEAEKFLIAYYGRKDLGSGCLRNMTDGGEGSTGARPSKETRELLSSAHLGNRNALGMRHTLKTCRALSLARKGKAWSAARKTQQAGQFKKLAQYGSHARWHVARGMFDADCALCNPAATGVTA